MTPLLPFARRGLPAPFLIVPRTREEASTGRATLIAAGDLHVLIAGIGAVAPERRDLIEKFEALAHLA